MHIQQNMQQNDIESRVAFRNLPKGAGAKQHQKKPRRGRNNIEQHPLVAEVDANAVTDLDLDDEPFHNVFVNDYMQAKTWMHCKVDFCRNLPIAPWDICIMHQEWYMYPVKDPQNPRKILRQTTTRKKLAKRFYCARKECLLPRHPYFWKGLLRVEENVKGRLRESHKTDLLTALRFQVQ